MPPEQTTPNTEDTGSQSATTPEIATTDSTDTSTTDNQYEMPSEEFETPDTDGDDEDSEDDEATSDDEGEDDNADQSDDDGDPADKADPEAITIDGVKLSPEEARQALAAYKNQQEWQRAYTQRDQKLAAEQKAWQESIEQKIAQGFNKTKTDEQLAAMTPEERQTEKWLKERGYMSKDEVQAAINQAISPFVKDIENFRQNEGTRQIMSEAKELMNNYGLNEDQVIEVGRFAKEHNMVHLPLEDSYFLMNKDNIMAAQAKAKENITKKIIAKKQAASRSLKPNGSDSALRSDGMDYDPSKHGKMSWRDLARSVR